MNPINEQTFLQIVRSNTFSSNNEYFQNELSVLADLLEEYKVESPSELKQKLQSSKKKSTSNPKSSKFNLFVDDCILCIANRDKGESVDDYVETLVQTFQESTPANIKKLAARFELNIGKKEDAPQFKTWLLTGQKPLSASEEKALLIQQVAKIYQDANGSFDEEKIQAILGIVKELKDKYSLKELKEFIQSFERDLTANAKDALIQKWENRLRGDESGVQCKPKRTSKQAKSLDLENNSYRDEIDKLVCAFYANPTNEVKRDTIQKIVDVVKAVKKDYNSTEQKKFVQTVFDSRLTGRGEDALLSKTMTFIENELLCASHTPSLGNRADDLSTPVRQSPNVLSQENQAPEFPLTLQAYTSPPNKTVASIENYVCQAVQLRDEQNDDLTDENILKIVELAENVKKFFKIEGLKSFMDALGISCLGVKNGNLLEKIMDHLGEVAIMRNKAVRIQEMR